ncbi:AMP-binding protein, partial [Vibrio fortis]
MHNLAVNLERSAAIFPKKPALRWQDKQISYQELNELSGKVAFHLKQLGIQRGDKVALSCPNTAEFVIAYYGILKAGAVVVPLNILFKAREVEYHL